MSVHEEIKQVTPWYSSSEWRHVFRMLYDSESDYEKRLQALNLMKMWKTRTPYMAGGIEGTIEILEAVLNDERSRKSGEQNLKIVQVAYSMAIMRFLNMIVDTTRHNTLFHMAQNLQIPSWMVTLRHDVAHSTKLPSLEILRKGAQFALHWVYEMYWKPENQSMVDCVPSTNELSSADTNCRRYLERYLTIYENIVLYMTEYRCRKIIDIRNHQARRDLIIEINTFLMSPNTYIPEHCHLKSVLFMVIKRVNEITKRFKNKQKRQEVYVDILMDCKFFMSTKVLDSVCPLSKQFVKLWVPVLDHVHYVGALTLLVKRLMDLSCQGSDQKMRDVAGGWVEIILKSIAKCKAVQKITETNYVTPPSTKRAITEVNANLPDLQSPIMFRPDIPMDEFFTSMDAIKYALLNNAGIPNGKYWKILLLLSDAELPAEEVVTLDYLQNLVNNIANNEKTQENNEKTQENNEKTQDNNEKTHENNEKSEENDQIYTVEDFENVSRKRAKTEGIRNYLETDGIQIVTVNGNYAAYDDMVVTESVWSEAPADLDWKSTPIGVLPKPLGNLIGN